MKGSALALLFFIFIIMEKKEYKTYDQPEDIYKEQWFKDMPWYKRAWARLVIAFFQTISMH